MRFVPVILGAREGWTGGMMERTVKKFSYSMIGSSKRMLFRRIACLSGGPSFESV
jgi:hypothetical protein